MGIVFHDFTLGRSLMPLTAFRPVADLTVGIGSIAENWKAALQSSVVAYATHRRLASLFPTPAALQGDTWHILGGALPSDGLVALMRGMPVGTCLHSDGRMVAAHVNAANVEWETLAGDKALKVYSLDGAAVVEKPWHLFQYAAEAIAYTLGQIRKVRQSQPLDASVQAIGAHDIFVEAGAELHFCTLNATAGPIYIGRSAEVMEGAHIRGPFALGDFSKVRMAAKIYGATSIGRHCKVGGEVDESVVQDYTNKAHDGYIGNACIGSWCNLGADTNCSNLKNNYAPVKVYSEESGRFEQTGLQFCGLIMGDHSKSGINTMFNTGTVVGAFCNIFGSGFPRAYIPAFSWGGTQGMREHPLRDALETARIVMARRDVVLTEAYEEAVRDFHEATAAQSGK